MEKNDFTNQEECYKIIVASADEEGNKALLNIIKVCIERDYYFRVAFAGKNVRLENIVESKAAEQEEVLAVEEQNE